MPEVKPREPGTFISVSDVLQREKWNRSEAKALQMLGRRLEDQDEGTNDAVVQGRDESLTLDRICAKRKLQRCEVVAAQALETWSSTLSKSDDPTHQIDLVAAAEAVREN